MYLSELPYVSIVVIGLNEEANLDVCMRSILDSNYPKEKIEIIYVDSGSNDKSIEIANKYTNRVFIEANWPSPARNRNRGLIESKYNLVHFIDGDIIIDKDYLKTAVEKLLEGKVQVVFGRLIEKDIKGLGKILLHEYGNLKEGIIDSPYAGGTFIKKVLIDVNGWDERIPRGEEPEIGERLRSAGYKIWFIDQKMGIHDYGVNNIYQFLKKQINEGKSQGKIMLISGEGVFFTRIKKTIRKNIILHILFIVSAIVSIVTHMYLLLLLLILVHFFYLFYKFRIKKKITNPDTFIYLFLDYLAMPFLLYGFLKFILSYHLLHIEDKNSLKRRKDIMKEIKKVN